MIRNDWYGEYYIDSMNLENYQFMLKNTDDRGDGVCLKCKKIFEKKYKDNNI